MKNKGEDIGGVGTGMLWLAPLPILRWTAVAGDAGIFVAAILSPSGLSGINLSVYAVVAACATSAISGLLIARSECLPFRKLFKAIAILGNIVAATVSIFYVMWFFWLLGRVRSGAMLIVEGAAASFLMCMTVALNLYFIFRERSSGNGAANLIAGSTKSGTRRGIRTKVIATAKLSFPLLFVVAYFCAGPISHVFFGWDWQEDNLISRDYDFLFLGVSLSVATIFFLARGPFPMSVACLGAAFMAYILAFYIPTQTRDEVVRDLAVAKIFLFYKEFKGCVDNAADVPGEGEFALCEEHQFDAPDPFGSFDEAIVYDTTGHITWTFQGNVLSSMQQSEVWRTVVFKVFPNITGDGSYVVYHLYGDFYFVIK